MFEDLEEGETHYCLACEAEANGIASEDAHTCGQDAADDAPDFDIDEE